MCACINIHDSVVLMQEDQVYRISLKKIRLNAYLSVGINNVGVYKTLLLRFDIVDFDSIIKISESTGRESYP